MSSTEPACEICSDSVGTNTDGDTFIACDVCSFPVCRPCYEYERKDGNHCCLQCKTRYKRHKGSPPIQGDTVLDSDLDDLEPPLPKDNINGNKPQEKMLAWHYSQNQSGELSDKDGSINHIPRLATGRAVSDDLSAASPGASGANIRISREFASPGF